MLAGCRSNDEVSFVYESSYTSKVWRMGVSIFRGVQYVHWVMHKCIMVKVGGKYM